LAFLSNRQRLYEVEQFFRRAPGQDYLHTRAYSKLITDLVNKGLWGKLDALWMFAARDSATALLNLKSSSFTASLVSAPTFNADRGFTGNGSSSYVDSNFNPTTSGGSFVQDSACFGAWSLTATIAAGSVVDAGWLSTNGTFLRVYASSGAFDSRINQGSSNSDANAAASGSGLFTVNRSTSTANQKYRNSTAQGTAATASTALVNHSLCFGTADGTTFSPRQWAAGFVSSSLGSTEQTNIYNAMLAYLQAVGAA
jgi:hypothetical protein